MLSRRLYHGSHDNNYSSSNNISTRRSVGERGGSGDGDNFDPDLLCTAHSRAWNELVRTSCRRSRHDRPVVMKREQQIPEAEVLLVLANQPR